MDLQISIFSIELNKDWCGIDILEIKQGFFWCSLLCIGKTSDHWKFDMLFMRPLFFWIKDKLKN